MERYGTSMDLNPYKIPEVFHTSMSASHNPTFRYTNDFDPEVEPESPDKDKLQQQRLTWKLRQMSGIPMCPRRKKEKNISEFNSIYEEKCAIGGHFDVSDVQEW